MVISSSRRPQYKPSYSAPKAPRHMSLSLKSPSTFCISSLLLYVALPSPPISTSPTAPPSRHRSGLGLIFLTGGSSTGGLDVGAKPSTGGKILVSLIAWLLTGLMPSCLLGAGMGSGSICAGIWETGDGGMRRGAGAGEERWGGGKGAGEECFVGEKEGRGAWEDGGKEECGLLKL